MTINHKSQSNIAENAFTYNQNQQADYLVKLSRHLQLNAENLPLSLVETVP